MDNPIMERGGFIRTAGFKSEYGLSASSVNRLEQTPDFPKRRRVGQRQTGFLRKEIDAYFENLPTVGEV